MEYGRSSPNDDEEEDIRSMIFSGEQAIEYYLDEIDLESVIFDNFKNYCA